MMLRDAFVWVSIVPGQICDSGGMSLTTTPGSPTATRFSEGGSDGYKIQ